jgi:hypothetical protein
MEQREEMKNSAIVEQKEKKCEVQTKEMKNGPARWSARARSRG